MFKRSSEVVRVRNPKNFDASRMASCSNETVYNCEFCAQEWLSETELHYHKRSHFSQIQNRITKQSHFCWTCIRPFKSRGLLTTHYKVCHLLSSIDAQRVEREIFACNDCGNIFFNKKMLILHMKIKHNRDNAKKQYFDCPSCCKSVSVKNAWNHVHLHEMVGLRICAICFKRFMKWKDLRQHSNTHKLYLYCDICNISYDKLNFYIRHLENHAEQSLDETDDETDLASVNKYYMPNGWNIKKAQYQNLLPYQGLKLQGDIAICVLCREICTSYKQRKQHILHHNTAIKPSYMTQEPVTTVDQTIIKNEFESEEILPKLACSCGETFAHKILLKQHLLRTKGSEFAHEALSERDIAHLIAVHDGYTIEIVD